MEFLIHHISWAWQQHTWNYAWKINECCLMLFISGKYKNISFLRVYFEPGCCICFICIHFFFYFFQSFLNEWTRFWECKKKKKKRFLLLSQQARIWVHTTKFRFFYWVSQVAAFSTTGVLTTAFDVSFFYQNKCNPIFLYFSLFLKFSFV